eukprot:13892570-Alexandrium_andersonii.AAC.1
MREVLRAGPTTTPTSRRTRTSPRTGSSRRTGSPRRTATRRRPDMKGCTPPEHMLREMQYHVGPAQQRTRHP